MNKGMKYKISLLHEDRVPPQAICDSLQNEAWQLSTIATRKRGCLEALAGSDCVVISVDGEDIEGAISIIEKLHDSDDNLPVVLLARSRSVENAVSAMKAGAFEYLVLPVDREKLVLVVEKGIRLYELTKKVFLLEGQSCWRDGLDNIVGQSQAMQEIFNMTTMVAKSNATVLITGESGTGKELIAQAIHRHSPRNQGSFIDINCGAIPRELLENELFGHERGSFTGADRRYLGSCERADNGTLFLDEISEMDPLLQVKLLRFLQERSFMRVGGTDPIKVDVRVVAATNRNIEAEVQAGRFREDLYYRLNVVHINIPPLRERREDIALLAKSFLDKYSAKNEKAFVDFSPQVLEALAGHDWQGNVRELENIIERIVVLNNDVRVKVSHLPPNFEVARHDRSDPSCEQSMAPLDAQRIIPLELVEKYAIEAAMRRCLGNVGEAARKLKIGQATLYRKIKQYGI